jgi:catechol 2,3-dioxygenase
VNRKHFLAKFLVASTVLTMDGFSTLANAMSHNIQDNHIPKFASYGAIHLNITNLRKSTDFYTKIVGMKVRKTEGQVAELGTETTTLLVLHETAKKKFQKGYSGIYHFAIHTPNESEFANMVYRVLQHKYPCSPTDHTMSKSLYLDDPDGINVEFTMETPERFKRVVTDRGIGMEGSDGVIRSASSQLDLEEVFTHLKDKNTDRLIHPDTYMGHIHLYANNVADSNAFYKKLGFIEFNYLPQFMYADVGAGGAYEHRIAMNSWHGQNRPMAPSDSAGMRHFHIVFNNQEKLDEALVKVPNHEAKDDGYWFKDPTGNRILLTKE